MTTLRTSSRVSTASPAALANGIAAIPARIAATSRKLLKIVSICRFVAMQQRIRFTPARAV
jgi:hypothetical protein